ncbi:hypothetical protein CAEBREN_05391 [Caenorhabditis brenneri]|uniref:7TM GPCR serpentine receptor class x (Srx) domain-containing protein n=1 Tax=Caenorhabditis brenneri TaxID=135651 RepID=G0NN24_CAEBE|nr:hypothetical protein CAEBREN_05391 [Caenorhabditis brenneri]
MTLKFYLGLFTFCFSLFAIFLNFIIIPPVFHLAFGPTKNSIYLIAFFNIISDLLELSVTCFYQCTSIMADRYLFSEERVSTANIFFGWVFMNGWFLESVVQVVMATNRIIADQAVLSMAFIQINGVYSYSNVMHMTYDLFCTVTSTLCYISVFRTIRKSSQTVASSVQKSRASQDIRYLFQFVFISIFYTFTWVFFEVLNHIATDVPVEFWIVVPICITCNCSSNAIIYLTVNREVRKCLRGFLMPKSKTSVIQVVPLAIVSEN